MRMIAIVLLAAGIAHGHGQTPKPAKKMVGRITNVKIYKSCSDNKSAEDAAECEKIVGLVIPPKKQEKPKTPQCRDNGISTGSDSRYW